MVIQIDGGASTNKGGQLMLVAVVQEIKKRFPDAEIFENDSRPDKKLLEQQFGSNYRLPIGKGMQKILSSLKLEKTAYLFIKKFWHRYSIFRAKRGVDIMLNVGGFQFGDQWNHNWYDISMWRRYLAGLKRHHTKVVFMPQAFGPFEKKGSKKILGILNKYADLLIARDDVSYNYLLAGGIDQRRIALYPDFTAPVKGIATPFVEQVKGKVCIIPNYKIFKKDVLNEEDYTKSLTQIVKHLEEKGFDAVLLNHEGEKDLHLCSRIAASMRNSIPIITGLNAIETKAVVGAAYLVVSSRYHGVANALSSCVPCLATSWSHKYQKLLEEFGQGDCLVDLNDMEGTLTKMDRLLEPETNANTRITLNEKTQLLEAKNQKMWDFVWKTIK